MPCPCGNQGVGTVKSLKGKSLEARAIYCGLFIALCTPSAFASEQVITGSRSSDFTTIKNLGISQTLAAGQPGTPWLLNDRAAVSQKLIRVAGAKSDKLNMPEAKSVVVEPATGSRKSNSVVVEPPVVSTKTKAKAKKVVIQPAAASSEDALLEDDSADDVAQSGSSDAQDTEQSANDSLIETAVESALTENSEEEAAEEAEEVAQSSDDDLLAGASDEEPAEASADNDLLDGDEEDVAQEDKAPAPTETADAEENKNGASEEDSAAEQHLNLFVENRYPSANTCGTCHPKHYKEWSVSQHAYAQLSPIYLSLNNKINKLSNGSNGDFCLRCHSPVGANLDESSFASNLDRHPASREGITCVVCHRIDRNYNKASGRLALVEGGLTEPVFGPGGNKGLKEVLDQPEKFRVVVDPKESGRKIHNESKLFQTIKTPVFCGTCHDVTLFNGFRLEEAFSEYRVSPAAAKGITCQDCHMGKIQGKVSGYEQGPCCACRRRSDRNAETHQPFVLRS